MMCLINLTRLKYVAQVCVYAACLSYLNGVCVYGVYPWEGNLSCNLKGGVGVIVKRVAGFSRIGSL